MTLNLNKRTFIIAEAGVNHNGNLGMAKRMIVEAKKCGADAIKFQHFTADQLVIKKAAKAPYQIKNTGNNKSQYEMLKKLELKENDYFELKKICQKKKIRFISSAFNENSISFLQKKLNEKIIKIPSGEITNFFLLKKINLQKTKILLSVGMSNYKDIVNAINLIAKKKIFKVINNNIVKIIKKSDFNKIKKKVCILHCVTDYPVNNIYANLNCIKNLQKVFKLDVGYSDHTLGLQASVYAVAIGAKIIEKHFTLNKNLSGPDHLASLSPKEFRHMVYLIREAENMLGNGIKKIEICEKKNIKIARKSLVAKKDIKKGDFFSFNNTTCKRPGIGLSPMKFSLLLNKRAIKNFKRDQIISN